MDNLLNPYIAGAPVLESSMFFGREDVFGWIERSLAGKYVDHILVIHGQRRVGKTSVLKQIPNFMGSEYLQVFFDLQGRVNTSLEGFLYWMARETTRTLQREYDLEVPKPDRAAFHEDAEQLIGDYIPTIQSQLNNHVLLLTFDEFDTLAREDIQDTLARPLVAYLRRLMDVEGLSFIFSIGSSGNKLENMQASYTDFFKSALYRKISFLDRVSCRRLITKPVEGEINYRPDAVNRIYQITAGHPYFTQLTCHELFSLCQKNETRQVTEDDVEAVIEDVIERGTVNLKFVWDEASDLEKWVLACLAQLEEGVTNEQLVSLLREKRIRFVESDLNSAVLHLREKDVLSQDNTFVIHLMRLWLAQNRPLDRVREELTEVNPIANRFIEIGDEYRDRGDLESAIDSYQQALGAAPKTLPANLKLAQTYLQNEDYSAAIEGFEKALSVDPEDVASQTGLCDAYLALGDEELMQGNEEGAIEYYQRVLTFNDSHEDARGQLADIFRSRAQAALAAGKDDQALSQYKQALEYTPDDEDLTATYQEVLAQKKAKVIEGWLQKADRALERQRWEAAIEAVEGALEIDPEDQQLQSRLEEVKDAQRQHQLGMYLDQVNQARAAERWDQAIEAAEKAIQLAPEDPSLAARLVDIKAARRQARIDVFQRQAERALRDQEWDAAIQALRGAAELAPDDPRWAEQIDEVEEQRYQAQLDALQDRAERAADDQEWDAAVAALEEYLELEPSSPEVEAEIARLQERQRQEKLASLKAQAQGAESAERWPSAVESWESYLELDPDDADFAKDALEQARKYQRIYADYRQAQASLRQGQYADAVRLLQGIIAQDPTYKATSRLLVEAVEARQSIPFWKKRWVYLVLGGVLSAALAGVFLPRVLAFDWVENVSMPSFSRSPTPVPTALPPTATPDPVQTLTDSIFSNITYRPPDFEDDFSERKSEWGFFITNTNDPSKLIMGKYIRDAALVLDRSDWADMDSEIEVQLGTTAKAETNNDGKTPLKGENFVLEFRLLPRELGKDDEFQLVIRALDDQNLYRIPLSSVIRQSDVINFDTWSMFQIITYEQDVFIYVNQTLVTRLEGIEPVGEDVFFAFTAGSGSGFSVSLDSIKFWRLEGGLEGAMLPAETPGASDQEELPPVDTLSPAPTVTSTPDVNKLDLVTIPDDLQTLISYANDTPPTFSDDFSTAKDEWGNFENYYNRESEQEIPTQHISHVVSNSVLHIQGHSVFPQTDLFEAENFIFEFEYDIKSRNDPSIGGLIGLKFHVDEITGSDSYFELDRRFGGWTLSVDGELEDQGKEGLGEQHGRVTIIVYDGLVYIFYNGKPVSSTNYQGAAGKKIYLDCSGGKEFRVNIDNVKFWNLDDVDLDAGS